MRIQQDARPVALQASSESKPRGPGADDGYGGVNLHNGPDVLMRTMLAVDRDGSEREDDDTENRPMIEKDG